MQPALNQLVNYVKVAKVFRRNKKNVSITTGGVKLTAPKTTIACFIF